MPDSDLEADAYQAWGESKNGWLFMPRDNFQAMASTGGGYFELDIAQTPLYGLSLSSNFEIAVAQQVSSVSWIVEAFRTDPKDAVKGTPINKDIYHVIVGGPNNQMLFSIASGIPSTSLDDNLIEFAERHVTFWKEPSSNVANHHSTGLPSYAKYFLKST